jgi:hypothetical protein
MSGELAGAGNSRDNVLYHERVFRAPGAVA